MTQFKVTGGARIGRRNTTFPFAILSGDQNKLELHTATLGNFIFSPSDVTDIKKHSSFSPLKGGIKITHKVNNYEKKIIFRTEVPESTLEKIQKTGFIKGLDREATAQDKKIQEEQQTKKDGQALFKGRQKTLAILGRNLLIIGDIARSILTRKPTIPAGLGILIGLLTINICSIFFLSSDTFRKRLFDNRFYNKTLTRRLGYFLLTITGFLTILVAIMIYKVNYEQQRL